MEKISKISKKTFQGKKIWKAAHAAFVCNTAKKVLRKLFDKDFLKNIKIISFAENTLYLSASNNFYAQEVKLKEKEIFEKINKRLSESIVRKIRFKDKTSITNY